MHQVPTVPITAENFDNVRIVLAPKSEGDKMTFYFDVVPPHFFSASVKDQHEWQALISTAQHLHSKKLAKGGLSFWCLPDIENRVARMKFAENEERKKSSLDDEPPITTRKSPRRLSPS